MSILLSELNATGSWEDKCAELTEILGHHETISGAVLNRALNDDKFAHYLIVAREDTNLLQVLLNDPKNKAFEPDLKKESHSNTALVKKAASSFLKWGKAGFKKIDPEVFEMRWSACNGCPFLADPPEQLAYRLTKVKKGPENKICTSCGCVAKRKAKLPHEYCPEQNPSDPAQNRWGQAWREKKEN